MVKAWYMDNDNLSDQRLENHLNPPTYIELPELYKKTRVEYLKLHPETYIEDGVLDKIRKTRGYTYEDEMTCSKDCLPDYEKTLKDFFTEHLHTEEEIRFIIDGSGYFDVRDGDDKWIRIHVIAGDMIVVPAGIYHRFTLDTNNYIKTKRYYIEKPVWLPYNRPADEMECRVDYLKQQAAGF